MGNDELIYRKIGAKIKALRNYKGVSQQKLAKTLGYSDGNTISYWESQKKRPSNKALQAVADFFGISREFFFKEFVTNIEIEYSTAKIDDMKLDEHLYLEAMSDLVREFKEEKKRKRE